jgi:hypothetical protein
MFRQAILKESANALSSASNNLVQKSHNALSFLNKTTLLTHTNFVNTATNSTPAKHFHQYVFRSGAVFSKNLFRKPKAQFFSTSPSKDLTVDISGIDKAVLLAALYNNSKPVGLGFSHPKAGKSMSYEEAKELLSSGQDNFDYVNGRVMKISLKSNELETSSYDRDNGDGKALAIVTACRNGVNIISIPAIPTNKMERLAAEGKIKEVIAEADLHISFITFRRK